MGTRIGTRLPMIFVKGYPAKLHEMTLVQLRKFVPFLVRCETRKEMPTSLDPDIELPIWWPANLAFATSVLNEKMPPKEMIQRLLKIVSRCYAQHNSSYLIAFSSSLASGNCVETQTFGKLTMVELDDGTTRILNAKGQLVVVVRTTTRTYDRDVAPQTKKRRRSARLVTQSTKSERSCNRKKKYDTVLEESNNSVTDDSRHKRPRKNLERSCRKSVGAENNADQIKDASLNSPEICSKGSKQKSKSQIKAHVRPQRMNPKAPLKLPCKHCGKEFTYQEILEEHETLCCNPQEQLVDIRDDVSKQENFLTSLGLRSTSSILESQTNPIPVPETVVVDLKAGSRNLRKVASRSKIGAILKAHPLPLTSERGQGLLEKFGERMKAEHFDGKRIEYEKCCNSRNYRVPAGPAPTISTLKKHMFKDNQYIHKFSFSKSERKKRSIELIVGMARKSFKLFNKCKGLSVSVERIPEALFNQLREKEENRRKTKQRKLEELIKRCLPIIELVDCRKNPLSLPLRYQKLMRI